MAVLFLFISAHVVYFEIFSRRILKNDLSAKKFHYIEENGESISVAAIGTSHTEDSIKLNKKYFYNYAHFTTWNPMVAYAKFSHLLEHSLNLKVIILEVDHISLLAYDGTLHTTVPEQYLYLLKHVKKPLYEKNKLQENGEQFPWLVSLHSDVAPVIHRKYLQNYLTGRDKKKEVSVWETLTPKEKMLRAKKRTHAYRIDSSSKIDKSVHDYYVKAIREAKKKGLKVYLLFNPQTKEYLAEINEENNIKVDDFVFGLARKEKVKILDYRHYFAENESFFENQDHVNKKGSEVLTKEVMKVIKNDF